MKPYIERLLKLISRRDAHSTLFWNSELEFSLHCDDVFCWGFADCERVSSQEDVDLLDQVYKTLENYDKAWDTDTAAMLYAATKRKMRPQGAMYRNISKDLHHLFDACGPQREIGLGNPLPQTE